MANPITTNSMHSAHSLKLKTQPVFVIRVYRTGRYDSYTPQNNAEPVIGMQQWQIPSRPIRRIQLIH